jgi:hypothetical protein
MVNYLQNLIENLHDKLFIKAHKNLYDKLLTKSYKNLHGKLLIKSYIHG